MACTLSKQEILLPDRVLVTKDLALLLVHMNTTMNMLFRQLSKTELAFDKTKTSIFFLLFICKSLNDDLVRVYSLLRSLRH
jgi:hypothetical protein